MQLAQSILGMNISCFQYSFVNAFTIVQTNYKNHAIKQFKTAYFSPKDDYFHQSAVIATSGQIISLKILYYFMSSVNLGSTSQAIGALCSQQLAIDRLAAGSIQSDSLKLIYDTFVNVSYVLFLVGGIVALATEPQIRQKFIDYLKRDSSLAYLIVMAILGVFSYTLMKAYGSDKKYSPETKKKINFAEDLIKETVFVIMVIFVESFVKENSSVITIVVAFYLYLASLVLFTIIFLIKWIYFLCGSGKDNCDPWTVKPVADGTFLNLEQKNAILKVANDYLKQEVGNNRLPQLGAGAPDHHEVQMPATQRQLIKQ